MAFDFFEQRAQVIGMKESKIDVMLENEVREAISLPEKFGQTRGNWYFEQERTITAEAIKRLADNTGLVNSVGTLAVDIAEREIRLAIVYLCGLIHAKYTATAQKLGLNLSPYNFFQVVETPITYLDLTPSSTSIRFKVFTRREIRAKFLE